LAVLRVSKAHSAYYELMFLDASYAAGQWDREVAEFLRGTRAVADRLIAECVSTGTFLPVTSPTTVRRTLWAAVHGTAVIALRKRLPAIPIPISSRLPFWTLLFMA